MAAWQKIQSVNQSVPLVAGYPSGVRILDLYAPVRVTLEDKTSVFASLDYPLNRREDEFLFRNAKSSQQIPEIGRLEIRIRFQGAVKTLAVFRKNP